jgi:hypothetical protein
MWEALERGAAPLALLKENYDEQAWRGISERATAWSTEQFGGAEATLDPEAWLALAEQ